MEDGDGDGSGRSRSETETEDGDGDGVDARRWRSAFMSRDLRFVSVGVVVFVCGFLFKFGFL